MTILDRFKSKMSKPTKYGCILYLGAISNNGYGNFWMNRKSNAAHRVSYELFIGKIPPAMLVLHKCDVRACVNPLHLFIGYQADNIKDMVTKKRNSCGIGNKHGHAILTIRKVKNIKKKLSMGIRSYILAKKYKVKHHTISDIKRNKTWKHV